MVFGELLPLFTLLRRLTQHSRMCDLRIDSLTKNQGSPGINIGREWRTLGRTITTSSLRAEHFGSTQAERVVTPGQGSRRVKNSMVDSRGPSKLDHVMCNVGLASCREIFRQFPLVMIPYTFRSDCVDVHNDPWSNA